MRAHLTRAALFLIALAVPASLFAADDDLPSFRKRPDKDKEKAWVGEVGTAVVKAARLGPKAIELDKYELKDAGKGRKDLAITMTWRGAVLIKRPFVSTIVVQVDVSGGEKWKVLGIDYQDDNRISRTEPDATKIRNLIEKFNR